MASTTHMAILSVALQLVVRLQACTTLPRSLFLCQTQESGRWAWHQTCIEVTHQAFLQLLTGVLILHKQLCLPLLSQCRSRTYACQLISEQATGQECCGRCRQGCVLLLMPVSQEVQQQVLGHMACAIACCFPYNAKSYIYYIIEKY